MVYKQINIQRLIRLIKKNQIKKTKNKKTKNKKTNKKQKTFFFEINILINWRKNIIFYINIHLDFIKIITYLTY